MSSAVVIPSDIQILGSSCFGHCRSISSISFEYASELKWFTLRLWFRFLSWVAPMADIKNAKHLYWFPTASWHSLTRVAKHTIAHFFGISAGFVFECQSWAEADVHTRGSIHGHRPALLLPAAERKIMQSMRTQCMAHDWLPDQFVSSEFQMQKHSLLNNQDSIFGPKQFNRVPKSSPSSISRALCAPWSSTSIKQDLEPHNLAGQRCGRLRSTRHLRNRHPEGRGAPASWPTTGWPEPNPESMGCSTSCPHFTKASSGSWRDNMVCLLSDIWKNLCLSWVALTRWSFISSSIGRSNAFWNRLAPVDVDIKGIDVILQ
jgi:hypothetical protein